MTLRNKSARRFGLRGQLMMSAAIAASGFFAYGRRAYAQCAPSGPNTYTCSGATAAAQGIFADNAQVLLGTPLDISTGDPLGLHVEGSGNLSITDTGAAGGRSIFGSNVGLNVVHTASGSGSGSITVNTDAVIGGGGYGVLINDTDAGPINVTLGGYIFSSGHGIFINKSGDGDVSLETEDTVLSDDGTRVQLGGAGDISITVGQNSTHYLNGTSANAIGAIAASGDVMVRNDGSLLALDNNSRGILAAAYDGRVEVTNNGLIGVGLGGVGILGYGAAGGSVVNNGDIYSSADGARGIYAVADSGQLAVTNNGDIALSGDATAGVMARLDGSAGAVIANTGTIDVTGKYSAAILVEMDSDGDLVVTNDGTIETDNGKYGGVGIVALQYGGDGDITITNNGDLGGGVIARDDGYGDGDISLTNNGNIVSKYGGMLGENESYGDLSITNNGSIDAFIGLIAETDYYAGESRVTVNGSIYAAIAGVVMTSDEYAGDLNFTSSAGSSIYAEGVGVGASGGYENDINITVDGDIAAIDGPAITVTSSDYGATNIDIGGTVSSSEKYAVHAIGEDGSVNITVRAGGGVSTTAPETLSKYGPYMDGAAILTSQDAGYSGSARVTVAGSVDAGPNGAQAIRMNGYGDDTLALHGTFQITGVADALTDPARGTDTLEFGGDTNGTFNVANIGGMQQFRGFENFSKEGDSRWSLTGTNLGIAEFAVNNGDLRVNGDMSATTFTVASGATIGGSGRLGTISLSGFVAPGNSIGTLNVTNITMQPTAVYEAEVAASGASDLIAASNTATINGASIHVVTLDPDLSYANGQTFTILTATGGVSGAFGAVTSTSLLLEFTPNYSSTAVTLTTQPVAWTGNQASVGLVLSLFQQGGPDALTVYNSLLALPSEARRDAFNLASGEAHASLQLAAAQAQDAFQATLARRAGSLSGAAAGVSERLMDGASVWGVVLGQGGDFEGGGGGSAELEHNLSGVAFGAEGGVAKFGGALTAGVAAGFTTGRGSVDGRASGADIDTWHIGGYAAWDNETVRVSGAASYGMSDIDSVRYIGWAGFAPRTATASRDADIFAATLEGAYRLPGVPMGFSLAPVVLLDYLHGSFGAAQETGAGSLNATILEKDFDRLEAGAGLEAAYDLTLGGRAFAIEGRAVYRDLLSGRSPAQPVVLEGAPGAAFAVLGPEQGDRVTLGLGVSSEVGDNLTLNARFDSSLSSDGDAHRATLGGSWRF